MVNIVKRRKVFSILKHHKIDIAFLQETHSTDENVKLWQSEWGSVIYASNATTISRGTLILIRRNMDCKIVRIEIDTEGRVLILELEINSAKLLFVNIYAPNQDCPQFFQKVADMIDSFDNCNIIWGGDLIWCSILKKTGLILHTIMLKHKSNC